MFVYGCFEKKNKKKKTNKQKKKKKQKKKQQKQQKTKQKKKQKTKTDVLWHGAVRPPVNIFVRSITQ